MHDTRVSCDTCQSEHLYQVPGSGACYAVCPPGHRYYLQNSKACFAQCPDGARFHRADEHECYYKCPTGYEYTTQTVAIAGGLQNINVLSYKCYHACPSGSRYLIEDGKICANVCPYWLPRFVPGEFVCKVACPTDRSLHKLEYGDCLGSARTTRSTS